MPPSPIKVTRIIFEAVAVEGTVNTMLEPTPVLIEGSPSPIRSISQLRFEPEPVVVIDSPSTNFVPTSGVIIVVCAA
ncbi:hypothetical protein HYW20_06240 [Candidatus Woesearchaeota archaeon]|nr:hypothetical protein [Candidatus Woesearchaeota archaeon]